MPLRNTEIGRDAPGEIDQTMSETHLRSVDLAKTPADEAGPDATPPVEPKAALHPATLSADEADAGGHSWFDTHRSRAPCTPIPGGAGAGVDQDLHETPASDVDPELIEDLRALWQRRQRWHRAEKSLTLQMKAFCRMLVGGDKAEADRLFKAVEKGGDHDLLEPASVSLLPFFEARRPLEQHRAQVEKALEKAAKRLPVWAGFVEDVRGVGPLSLAGIVGEAGDVGAYRNPSCLWKRMGLAVINGGRQRRVAGEAALEHGYAPHRRSLVWNLGEAFLKAGGEYRAIYLARVAVEVEKAEAEGLTAATTNKTTVESWRNRDLPDLLKVSKLDPQKHRGAGHIHNRAKRYAEKRFLRDLYAAWRRTA